MLRVLAPLAALALALPATAQELLPRYEVMGTATVMVDATEYTLLIPRDRETGNAFAAERSIMGRRNINLLASAVGEDGNPGGLMLQLTFWVSDGAGDLQSAEVFDQGMDAPLAAGPDGGSVAFASFSITETGEGNAISAEFSGDFVRMENYMSDPAPAQGADPVPVSGTVTVSVPKNE